MAVLAILALFAVPTPAAAYVGPGAGLVVIGAAIAVIGAVFAAVGGFVWYPVKRIWKAMSRNRRDAADSE